MSESLHLTRNGSILEITLDRPKANAIDAKTSFEMGEVFLNFRDDPQLRVAIITGAGEKFFSAGWDLKAAAEGEAPDECLHREHRSTQFLCFQELSPDYFFKRFLC